MLTKYFLQNCYKTVSSHMIYYYCNISVTLVNLFIIVSKPKAPNFAIFSYESFFYIEITHQFIQYFYI